LKPLQQTTLSREYCSAEGSETLVSSEYDHIIEIALPHGVGENAISVVVGNGYHRRGFKSFLEYFDC